MSTVSVYSPNNSQQSYINEDLFADTRLIAPAGCGKTMTLLHRATRVVEELKRHGIQNPQVLIVTFTNAARMELERKIGENSPLKQNIVISTLNKLGSDLLKSHAKKLHHDSPVYTDGSDIAKRNKWYYHCFKSFLEKDERFELLWHYLQDERGKLDSENTLQLFSVVDRLKETGMDLESFDNPNCFSKLVDMYKKKTISALTLNMVCDALEEFIPSFPAHNLKNLDEDGFELVLEFFKLFKESTIAQYEDVYPRFFSFEDQKYWPLYMLRKGENLGLDRFNALFVDEFQDINALDLFLIKAIRDASATKNGLCSISAVGDVDQAIFEWRGAVTNYIVDIGKHFPKMKTHQLDINYRMPANIVVHSQMLIANNPIEGYIRKKVAPYKKDNAEIRFLSGENPLLISDSVLEMVKMSKKNNDSITLLGRKRSQLVLYQVLMIEQGLPFYVDDDLNIAFSDAFNMLLKSLSFFVESDPLYDDYSLDHQLEVLFYFGSMWGRYKWSDTRKTMIRRDVDNEFYNQQFSMYELLDFCVERYAKPGKRNITNIERICRDIQDFLDSTKVSDALEILATRFDRFKKNCISEDENDIFNLDPPFELLQYYSAKYGRDFKAFINTISNARDEIIKLNESRDNFTIEPGMTYIMTATRSKGREFDHVVMLDCVDKIWPCSWPVGARRNLQEERRIFYVAMTRAKKSLTLTVPTEYAGISVSHSPYVSESGLNKYLH